MQISIDLYVTLPMMLQNRPPSISQEIMGSITNTMEPIWQKLLPLLLGLFIA